MRVLSILALVLQLAGCANIHYPVNEPLTQSRQHDGYATRNLTGLDNSDSLALMIAFSGGGYRAAAMAMSALEVLRDTQIEWEGHQRSLLQELDVISAVSGGSLAAAFYARDPDRFFDEFGPRVLDFDLQAAMLTRSLSLRGLWRQTSDHFGRGDILQELLDEQVFHGLEYGALPRRRPMAIINATDMRFGDRFEFTQDQFDHLCADLDRVPVARAVAASMAVPVVLSPVTFWSHRERCPLGASLQPPPLPAAASRSRFVHLVDGGLADNTGLRGPLDTVAAHGSLNRTMMLSGFGRIQKRVFIIINAQAPPRHIEDESPRTPPLWRQLRSAIDVPIDRYSDSSVQAFEQALQRWQASGEVDATETYLIEIGVTQALDRDAAEALRAIPTALRITSRQRKLIRDFVRNEFAVHPEWQRLVRQLRNTSVASQDSR